MSVELHARVAVSTDVERGDCGGDAGVLASVRARQPSFFVSAREAGICRRRGFVRVQPPGVFAHALGLLHEGVAGDPGDAAPAVLLVVFDHDVLPLPMTWCICNVRGNGRCR